jgi:lysozyme family protein
MITDATLILGNQVHWEKAHLKPAARARAHAVAQKIMGDTARSIYEKISCHTTGLIPWHTIGIIHYRECDFAWTCNLAQGDPYKSVSRHVPKGRGPFHSWEEAAIDALMKAPPFAGRWTNWTAGGTLTILEKYNGLGYELYHHMTSPYVYGGTDQQMQGKYTADSHFDPSAWDTQLGTAAIYLAMREIDPSIKFQGE